MLLDDDPNVGDDLEEEAEEDEAPPADPPAEEHHEEESHEADPSAEDEARRTAEEAEVERVAKVSIEKAKGDPIELARMHARASRVVGRQGNDLGAARKERDLYKEAFQKAGGTFDAAGTPIIPSKPAEPARPAPTVDPQTGYHVDPATGRKTDPATGNYTQKVRSVDGGEFEQLYDKYGVEIIDAATMAAIEKEYGPDQRRKVEETLHRRRLAAIEKSVQETADRVQIGAKLPEMKAEAKRRLESAGPVVATAPEFSAALDKAYEQFQRLPSAQMTQDNLDVLTFQELVRDMPGTLKALNDNALRIAASQVGNPKPTNGTGNGNGSGAGNGTANGTGSAKLPAGAGPIYRALKEKDPTYTVDRYNKEVEARRNG